jgi:hypothetical protein
VGTCSPTHSIQLAAPRRIPCQSLSVCRFTPTDASGISPTAWPNRQLWRRPVSAVSPTATRPSTAVPQPYQRPPPRPHETRWRPDPPLLESRRRRGELLDGCLRAADRPLPRHTRPARCRSRPAITHSQGRRRTCSPIEQKSRSAVTRPALSNPRRSRARLGRPGAHLTSPVLRRHAPATSTPRNKQPLTAGHHLLARRQVDRQQTRSLSLNCRSRRPRRRRRPCREGRRLFHKPTALVPSNNDLASHRERTRQETS